MLRRSGGRRGSSSGLMFPRVLWTFVKPVWPDGVEMVDDAFLCI